MDYNSYDAHQNLSEILTKLKIQIKTETKYAKMMKQHPNMLDMLKIYCKKWKQ
jgi:hypothetical protein